MLFTNLLDRSCRSPNSLSDFWTPFLGILMTLGLKLYTSPGIKSKNSILYIHCFWTFATFTHTYNLSCLVERVIPRVVTGSLIPVCSWPLAVPVRNFENRRNGYLLINLSVVNSGLDNYIMIAVIVISLKITVQFITIHTIFGCNMNIQIQFSLKY